MVTYGLSRIKYADTTNGGTGVLPTSWTDFPLTKEGTFSFAQEDGETTDFYAEEVDRPLRSNQKQGKTTLTWEIVDASLDDIQMLLGGTVSYITGSTGAQQWVAPTSHSAVYKALRLETRDGFIFAFPHVKLEAKFNGSLSKTDTWSVSVTATVFAPKASDDTMKPDMYIQEPAA